MKHPPLALLIYIFMPAISLAQTVTIKPKFAPGDSVNYIVTQKEKTSVLFTLSKGEHQFEATFKILDTTKGYSISFTTKLLKPINKKFIMEYALDKLRDGFSLIYKLDTAGWLIDIADYAKCKVRAADILDSIIFVTDFSKKEHRLLQVLRDNIEQPDGLHLLLDPILLFNGIYVAPSFRKQTDYHPAHTVNIFYQPQIAGTWVTKLKTFDEQTRAATVSLDFAANTDSASKRLIPVYHEILYRVKGKVPRGLPDEATLNTYSDYDMPSDKGFPKHIEKKIVITYLAKETSEIIMEKVEE